MSEAVIGYGEICRNHGIGGPEDLDTALSDYEMLAKHHKDMISHYTEEQLPIRAQDGNYLCPSCGKRIREWYTFCNHCGKKVGWNGLLDPKNRRFGYGSKQARKEHHNKYSRG